MPKILKKVALVILILNLIQLVNRSLLKSGIIIKHLVDRNFFY